jgi:hypothetical protein
MFLLVSAGSYFVCKAKDSSVENLGQMHEKCESKQHNQIPICKYSDDKSFEECWDNIHATCHEISYEFEFKQLFDDRDTWCERADDFAKIATLLFVLSTISFYSFRWVLKGRFKK